MIDDLLTLKAASNERCDRRARVEYVREPATFAEDLLRQDATTLNIVRACDAALDIGQHLILRERAGAPQSARNVLMIVPTLPRAHATRPLPRRDAKRPEFGLPRRAWEPSKRPFPHSPLRLLHSTTETITR